MTLTVCFRFVVQLFVLLWFLTGCIIIIIIIFPVYQPQIVLTKRISIFESDNTQQAQKMHVLFCSYNLKFNKSERE